MHEQLIKDVSIAALDYTKGTAIRRDLSYNSDSQNMNSNFKDDG